MKNNLPALLFGTAMMVVVPGCAGTVTCTISLPQGGQFRLSISNTDPNMILSLETKSPPSQRLGECWQTSD
ncbi:Uncharacterised protein [Citrobacter freundii]|nr:Uncharacterised protein [Citrobacter freundii]